MTESRRVRVLVADDNRDAAESLALLLEVLGFDTRAAHDGEQAWGAALTFRPDACVLDVHMPHADGCEVARRVRRAFGRRVLLVAVTGVAGGPYDDRMAAAGFDVRFVKPADPTAVARLLAQAEERPATSLPPSAQA